MEAPECCHRSHKGRIETDQGGKRNADASHPHSHQKFLYYEHRRIGAIRQWLGKEACGRHLSEMQLHEKGLQEPQPPLAGSPYS